MTKFYLSADGNDTNPGSEYLPWETISKVNGESFSPGDSILFKRGDGIREGVYVGKE